MIRDDGNAGVQTHLLGYQALPCGLWINGAICWCFFTQMIPYFLSYIPTYLNGEHQLAFMELAWRKLVKEKATVIQCFSRQWFSRNALARLREARRILERDMATKIQANARCIHCWRACAGEVKISHCRNDFKQPPIDLMGACQDVAPARLCCMPPSMPLTHTTIVQWGK